MAGLTEQGLVIRTQSELQQRLEERLAADEDLRGLNLKAGPIQQLIGVVSEELADAWEALRAVYGAAYRESASGVSLDRLSALTGSSRRQATKSRVTGTVVLAAGATLPAGTLASVDGSPDSVFATVDEVTNAGPSQDSFSVVFEATVTGPVAAPAGTLTIQVSGVAGWVSVTNALDASLGRSRAEDPELREQGLLELPGGSSTLQAIRAGFRDLDTVIEVQVYENNTLSVDGDGRPAKSVEVVVWDGDPPATLNNDIAQVIWDNKPAGIAMHGAAFALGTAFVRDIDGNLTDQIVEVPFTRATTLRVYLTATVVLSAAAGGSWLTQARAAVVERALEYKVGETAYASQFVCALLEVPGIVAVPTLTIGTAPAPVGTTVTATYSQIIRVSSGDVTASSV